MGNTFMSAPVSATNTSAVIREKPGMLVNRSRAARKGCIASSIRASRRAMSALWASMRSRNSRVMNAWWVLNRPLSASVSAGIFCRIRPWARSASTAGSRCPSISASSIARPETPVMSEATEDSLIPASSSSFSNRWTSRARSRVMHGAGAGQIPQRPDRRRRHERRLHQPVRAQIGQPRRIRHVFSELNRS